MDTKKTSLYKLHQDSNAKFVEFAGYQMPIQYSEGIVEGIITIDPKGSGGFGYDPIFLPKGSQSTFSEMTQMEKNKISHRAKALIKMKKLLKHYF